MDFRFFFASLAIATFITSAVAQSALLIDPAKAPLRLSEGWKSASGGNRSGEVIQMAHWSAS